MGEQSIGDYDKDGTYTMGGASLDPSLVKGLSIDWLNDTVSVVSYDGSTVEISEISADPLNDTTTMYYRLTPDGLLSVKFSKSGAALRSGSVPSKHLFVRVPRGHRLDEIEINGLGQYIGIDSVVCGDMELNSVSNYLMRGGGQCHHQYGEQPRVCGLVQQVASGNGNKQCWQFGNSLCP